MSGHSDDEKDMSGHDDDEKDSYHSDDGERCKCSMCGEVNPKRYVNVTRTLPTKKQWCPYYKGEDGFETHNPDIYMCYKVVEDQQDRPNGSVWIEHECSCGGELVEEKFVITICLYCYREKYV